MNERDHLTAAFRFLQLADDLTVERDALAKSEMLWCAAAQAVKAIAVQQKWDNNMHEYSFDCARRLSRTIGYPDAISDFYEADNLHRNMYRGHLSRRALMLAEAKVRRFVNHIADAVDDLVPPNGTP